jgi:hypothetical protein
MASGDSLVIWTALANEPPASNYATFDSRNSHPVLDFDGGTNESAVFKAVMPQHYASGGVTVYIHYSMESDITNDIDWDVAFERIGDGIQDIDSDGFQTAKSVDGTTVPGTSGHVDVVSINFSDGATEMDSVTKGDLFRIKVTRDAASDTSTTDAELHAVEIREQ